MSKLDRRTFFTKSIGAALAVPALSSLKNGVANAFATPELVSGASSPTEGGASQRSSTRPPNLVVMVCDDLGSGDLGCYGSTIKTPNLNRMATEGVRFTHFNTVAPVCSVSRAAWLTGRYAVRSHTQDAYFPNTKEGMDLDEKTLADILKTRGYKSLCIGKWHLGELPQYMPTNRGFDSFFGVPYSDDMNPLPLIRDLTPIEATTNRDLLTPRYTEEAVKFIDTCAAQPEKPFFLWLAYSYPHDPARASSAFYGKSDQGVYGDCVQEIDWSAGQVLEAVRRNHLDSNTIVIFSSDHGPWYQGSPGALRGRKHTTYEGGLRLPFIARWTGKIPAGKTVNAWGSNTDLVPTVAALCGAQLPHPVDGINITNLLTGRGPEPARGTILYFLDGALECARKGSWKLRISLPSNNFGMPSGGGRGSRAARGPGRAPGAPQETATPRRRVRYMFANPELYNLALDPEESYNQAHAHPEIVKEILSDIESQMPSFPKDVIEAYAAQKANPDSPRTPSGAAPRPADYVPPAMIWDPPRGY